MRKKIVGILVCTLLITTVILPVTMGVNIGKTTTIQILKNGSRNQALTNNECIDVIEKSAVAFISQNKCAFSGSGNDSG